MTPVDNLGPSFEAVVTGVRGRGFVIVVWTGPVHGRVSELVVNEYGRSGAGAVLYTDESFQVARGGTNQSLSRQGSRTRHRYLRRIKGRCRAGPVSSKATPGLFS